MGVAGHGHTDLDNVRGIHQFRLSHVVSAGIMAIGYLPHLAPATCRLKAPEYLSKQDRVHGMYYPSPSGHRRMNVPPDGGLSGLVPSTYLFILHVFRRIDII